MSMLATWKEMIVREIRTPETRHERDCAYVISDGPAPCTCRAGAFQVRKAKQRKEKNDATPQ